MIVAVEPIIQKDAADCAVCALAMLLGRPYRTVFEAAQRRAPNVRTVGLYSTQMVRIAKDLGVTLKLYPKHLARAKYGNHLIDTGLLTVYRYSKRKKEEHAVTVFEGVVVNSADGIIYRLDAFLAQGGWSINGYMEVQDDASAS